MEKRRSRGEGERVRGVEGAVGPDAKVHSPTSSVYSSIHRNIKVTQTLHDCPFPFEIHSSHPPGLQKQLGAAKASRFVDRAAAGFSDFPMCRLPSWNDTTVCLSDTADDVQEL
ncbi:hypothetical protein STEG23_000381, partial [Scotinomys teguina]